MGGASPYRARFVGSSPSGGGGQLGQGGSSGGQGGGAPLGANGEKFFGLVNVSNTCYVNSVLQALYFCAPFRRFAISHLGEEREEDGGSGETLLHSLSELFQQIDGQKRAVGSLAPRRFLARLRKANDLFSTSEHQDAHEFLQFLLNDIDDLLAKRAKRQREKERQKQQGAVGASSAQTPVSAAAAGALGEDEEREQEKDPRTWVQDIFQGFLVNQMKCLCCENVTVRRETFLDLSVDIERHTSIAACLRAFESTELLRAGNKFFCDSCGCLQEAEKRHRIYQLPSVLTLHLKRFKYVERVGRCCRLPYRVVFPLQLRVVEHRPPRRHAPGGSFGVEEATENGAEIGSAIPAPEPPSRLFELRSVVVHIGRDLHRGHYVTVVRSGDRCVLLDDDIVREVEPEVLRSFYGTAGQDGQQGGQQAQQHSGGGWGGGENELGSAARATSAERVATHSTATPLYERSPEGTCCGYMLFYEAVDGAGSLDTESVAAIDIGAGAAADWISEDRNLDDSDGSDESREAAVSDARPGVPGANPDDGELTQAFEQRCIPRGPSARQPPPHLGSSVGAASSPAASGAPGATRPTLDWTSPSAAAGTGAFAWTASDEEGGRAPLPGAANSLGAVLPAVGTPEGAVSLSRVNVVTVPTPSSASGATPSGGAEHLPPAASPGAGGGPAAHEVAG